MKLLGSLLPGTRETTEWTDEQGRIHWTDSNGRRNITWPGLWYHGRQYASEADALAAMEAEKAERERWRQEQTRRAQEDARKESERLGRENFQKQRVLLEQAVQSSHAEAMSATERLRFAIRTSNVRGRLAEAAVAAQQISAWERVTAEATALLEDHVSKQPKTEEPGR